MEGLSLLSDDNTEEQNRRKRKKRMLSVTTALDQQKHLVLRQAAQRYEITALARGKIMHEFSKSILDTTGVPEHFQAQYRENLLSLQQGVNELFASLIHALGTSESLIHALGTSSTCPIQRQNLCIICGNPNACRHSSPRT